MNQDSLTFRPRASVACATVLTLLGLLVSCTDTPPRGQSISTLVGASGGVAPGPGGVSLTVPAGAVGSDLTLTIATVPSAAPPPGKAAVATPLSLTPKGTIFSSMVSLTIPLTGGLPAGRAITDVVVMQGDYATNVFVPVATQPSGNAAVIATVQSLGDFVAVVNTGTTGVDASVVTPPDGSVAFDDAGVSPDAGASGGDGGVPPADVGIPVGPDAGTSSLMDNGDGTVTDTRTQLLWQQAMAAAPGTQSVASTNCSTLNLVGTGWRLPTVQEVVSILDFSAPNALGPPFSVTSPTMHTSTADPQMAGVQNFQVSVTDGSVTLGPVASMTGYLCVRGTDPVNFAPQWMAGPTGVVIDLSTTRVWQGGDNGTPLLYTDAQNYCATLNAGGMTGFRLPTLMELARTVDTTRAMPAVDINFFAGTQSLPYWTSTPRTGRPGEFWTIDFSQGLPSSSASTSPTPVVRCVR